MYNQKGFISPIFIFLIAFGVMLTGGTYVVYKDQQIQNRYRETIQNIKKPELQPTPKTSENISTSSSQPKPSQTIVTKNNFLLTKSLCSVDYAPISQSENNARRLLDLCEVIIPKIEAKFGRWPRALPYKIQFYTPAPGSQGTGADARAYVDGSGTIILSTEWWYKQFPYDEKILAHEITHAIQSFYGYNTPQYPAWLIESLADYSAYLAGYSSDLKKDCYGFSNPRQIKIFNCTYKFLVFLEEKYDSQTSLKLHKALQLGTYSENLWVQYTGKTYEQLISECSKDLDCGGTDPL